MKLFNYCEHVVISLLLAFTIVGEAAWARTTLFSLLVFYLFFVFIDLLVGIYAPDAWRRSEEFVNDTLESSGIEKQENPAGEYLAAGYCLIALVGQQPAIAMAFFFSLALNLIHKQLLPEA